MVLLVVSVPSFVLIACVLTSLACVPASVASALVSAAVTAPLCAWTLSCDMEASFCTPDVFLLSSEVVSVVGDICFVEESVRFS